MGQQIAVPVCKYYMHNLASNCAAYMVDVAGFKFDANEIVQHVKLIMPHEWQLVYAK